MRITGILSNQLYKIYVHKIPYRFRGKHRKEKEPSYYDMMCFKRDLDREERNMLLLRHPYLTIEQSHGHMKEFKRARFEKVLKDQQEEKNSRFNRRITTKDRLNYYVQNEAWD
nr:uncharacterized protein LOC116426838 [Nomia melanderi]